MATLTEKKNKTQIKLTENFAFSLADCVGVHGPPMPAHGKESAFKHHHSCIQNKKHQYIGLTIK